MEAAQIKAWLDKEGKSRSWLADQCKVSKATVDGWLSAGRTIPGPAASIIQNLMDDRVAIEPRLTVDVFAKAQRKADQEGVSLDDWISKLIAREVQADTPAPTSKKRGKQKE